MFREMVEALLPLEAPVPPEAIGATVSIVRKDDATHRIWGWAYITRDKDGNQIKDLKNAICPTEVLEEGVYEFNRRAVRPSGDMHETSDGENIIQQGWIIESMVFTREKCDAMGIPPGILPEGWWICAEVPETSACWQAIARGERKDFSIGGSAVAEYL